MVEHGPKTPDKATKKSPSLRMARRFIKDAYTSSVAQKVKEKKQSNKAAARSWARAEWLLLRYIKFEELTHDDLKTIAGVTTHQRVSNIIRKGITDLWNELPIEIQRRYPLYELLEEIRSAKLSVAHRERNRHERKQTALREHEIFPNPNSQN